MMNEQDLYLILTEYLFVDGLQFQLFANKVFQNKDEEEKVTVNNINHPHRQKFYPFNDREVNNSSGSSSSCSSYSQEGEEE